MSQNSVDDCLSFFQKAVPDPTTKNTHTQIGCHFEEVAEMIDCITPLESEAADLLAAALDAVHNLATFLKASDDAIVILESNRVEFLDAIADQMVTGIGSAHMLDMDIIGGFNEVNASNLSKFDEHGEPIFDANRKVTKGPNYRKAVLDPFV